MTKLVIEDRKYRGLVIFLLVIAILLSITSIILYTTGNECWQPFGGFSLIFFLIRYIFHIISYVSRFKRYTKQNMGFDEIKEKLFSG